MLMYGFSNLDQIAAAHAWPAGAGVISSSPQMDFSM